MHKITDIYQNQNAFLSDFTRFNPRACQANLKKSLIAVFFIKKRQGMFRFKKNGLSPAL